MLHDVLIQVILGHSAITTGRAQLYVAHAKNSPRLHKLFDQSEIHLRSLRLALLKYLKGLYSSESCCALMG